MASKLNKNKVKIKYIGSNKSYTFGRLKFKNNDSKIYEIDEDIAEKLLSTENFISLNPEGKSINEKNT